MTGIELIAAERQRQLKVEGWTSEHDDSHMGGEMAIAASCYAVPVLQADRRLVAPERWPWAHKWWKPNIDYGNKYIYGNPIGRFRTGRIRDLVKAGALIAAEIDRLQRATPNGG